MPTVLSISAGLSQSLICSSNQSNSTEYRALAMASLAGRQGRGGGGAGLLRGEKERAWDGEMARGGKRERARKEEREKKSMKNKTSFNSHGEVSPHPTPHSSGIYLDSMALSTDRGQ